MAIEISQRDLQERTSVVEIAGEVDLAAAPKLKWNLLDLAGTGRTRIVVDMSKVSFLDSTGLGALVGVKKSLGDEGLLAIACPQPNASRVFEVTGLDATFRIFSRLEEAVAYALGHEANGG
jgi:anti-sigma B factor antagonist